MKTNETMKTFSIKYENMKYFSNDPISVVRRCTETKDIEILAFLCSWVSICDKNRSFAKAEWIYNEMNGKPYEYLMNNEWERFQNDEASFYFMIRNHDFYVLMMQLKDIYSAYPTFEKAVNQQMKLHSDYINAVISLFNVVGVPQDDRSACKRVALFLRWMVRTDSCVDLGIWRTLDQSRLIVPLDTNNSKIAKQYGLLSRKRDDMKAAIELTDNCRMIFPDDPAKMDYFISLCGTDIEEEEVVEIAPVDIKSTTNNNKPIEIISTDVSDKLTPITAYNTKKPLVVFKDQNQLRYEAYNRICKNHPELLTYATFSELAAIEVFKITFDRLIPYIKQEGLYKQSVKLRANMAIKAFDKWYAKVFKHSYCGDVDIVRNGIEDIDMDVTKAYFSFKNAIDRHKEPNSSSLAMIMLCIGMCDLIISMHNVRDKQLKEIEPNMGFMDFMKPTCVAQPLTELMRSLINLNKSDLVIDLNSDSNCKLAFRVIDTKVNSKDRINEIVEQISKVR